MPSEPLYVYIPITYLPCLVLIFFSPNKHRNESCDPKCKRYKRKFRKKGNEKKNHQHNSILYITKIIPHFRSSLCVYMRSSLLSVNTYTVFLLLHECILCWGITHRNVSHHVDKTHFGIDYTRYNIPCSLFRRPPFGEMIHFCLIFIFECVYIRWVHVSVLVSQKFIVEVVGTFPDQVKQWNIIEIFILKEEKVVFLMNFFCVEKFESKKVSLRLQFVVWQ